MAWLLQRSNKPPKGSVSSRMGSKPAIAQYFRTAAGLIAYAATTGPFPFSLASPLPTINRPLPTNPRKSAWHVVHRSSDHTSMTHQPALCNLAWPSAIHHLAIGREDLMESKARIYLHWFCRVCNCCRVVVAVLLWLKLTTYLPVPDTLN